ncbi:MAG: amidohydrolase family protein [Candidatus Zipacnadales bacterium]
MKRILAGVVHTATSHGSLENAQVIIDDHGRIRSLQKIANNFRGETIDCREKVVIPGLIDAHTHLGLFGDGTGQAGQDGNEAVEPITPHVRAIDALDPLSGDLRDALLSGITAVFSVPGSANLIGGQGLVLRTYGSPVIEERIIKAPAGLKAALGENPKRVYSSKGRMPSTRLGNAAVMREALLAAQNYAAKQRKKRKKTEDTPDRDLKQEALCLALDREIPLRGHAHTANDIVTFIRIAEEFGMDLVIDHCTEGHIIAEYLATKGVPAAVGPLAWTRRKVETRRRTVETPALLTAAGVKVAIITDAPVCPINLLPICVGLAIKAGLSWEEGLKSVTINAAEICGVADRIGSLARGKEADLVVLDGDPFEVGTHVEQVWIRGQPVDLEQERRKQVSEWRA